MPSCSEFVAIDIKLFLTNSKWSMLISIVTQLYKLETNQLDTSLDSLCPPFFGFSSSISLTISSDMSFTGDTATFESSAVSVSRAAWDCILLSPSPTLYKC